MVPFQHVRSPRPAAGGNRRFPGAIVAGAWLGLFLAACQGPDAYFRAGETGPGQGGAGPSGAAGRIVSGAAGSIVSGAAGTAPGGGAGTIVSGTGGSIVSGTGGSIVSGTAGSTAGASAGGAGVSGNTGTAGTTGAAGTGAAGTTGLAGRGGAMGTAGAGGRGGAAGAIGMAGRGGSNGTAGVMGMAGRGGTNGTAGSGGRGGATGTAGIMGTAGMGGAGASSCPLGGRLDCTAAGSLKLTPDGQVIDFSAAQWNATTDKWCDTHGLDGGVSAFAGTGSTATAAVDTTAQNLKLNFTVSAGQYAGGRVNFDSCVDASGFNSVQFTASVMAGSLTGCAWQIQIETQEQRPSTLMNPTGGTCNAMTTTCERYPAASLAAATATATTYTTRFTAFTPASAATATAGQIVGLQWQVNSGNNGAGTCTVELRIDNVRFVSQ